MTRRERAKLETVWRSLGSYLRAPVGQKPARIAARRVGRTPRRVNYYVHGILHRI